MKILTLLSISILLIGLTVTGQTADKFEIDEFKTDGKTLKVVFLGHGTLYFDYD
jgi:hypothetical protein